MKRLKNNSGATILMALLLILLATVVGAAVLTAAVSAARHLRGDREAQQNYLTVSSAAELIREANHLWAVASLYVLIIISFFLSFKP